LFFLLLSLALPLTASALDEDDSAGQHEQAAEPSHRQAEVRRMEAYWRQHIAPAGEPHEPQQVLDALQAASKKGHPDAQFALGLILIDSDQEAARTKGAQWLTEAGRQGHPVALMQLGMLAIDSGDPTSAFTHFEAASATGDPDANYSLGLMYLNGENVAADPSRAADLFQVAANAGHADAQLRLATALWNAQSRSRDLEEAYFWFLLAAPENSRAAEFLPSAEESLLPAQIDAAKQRAATWQPTAYVPRWVSKQAADD
jgi:TPR repeat protein